MKYTTEKEFRAMFNKSGNIKLGNTWAFSTAMGDDIIETVYNGKYYACRGTCGKYCQGCKAACYVKKSYRYKSVKYSHIRNTNAMIKDMGGAFSDLRLQIVNAKVKPEMIRINQSGEMINKAFFAYWCGLASEFPDITFWAYSKAFDIVIPALLAGIVPDNLIVLISIWHEYGIKEYFKVCHLTNVKAFVYDDGFSYKDYGIVIQTYCLAYALDSNGKMKLNHDITCQKCRKCFNHSDTCKVIGCLPH